jgi:hypothetical protein
LNLQSKNENLKGLKNQVSIAKDNDRSFHITQKLDESFNSEQPRTKPIQQ